MRQSPSQFNRASHGLHHCIRRCNSRLDIRNNQHSGRNGDSATDRAIVRAAASVFVGRHDEPTHEATILSSLWVVRASFHDLAHFAYHGDAPFARSAAAAGCGPHAHRTPPVPVDSQPKRHLQVATRRGILRKRSVREHEYHAGAHAILCRTLAVRRHPPWQPSRHLQEFVVFDERTHDDIRLSTRASRGVCACPVAWQRPLASRHAAFHETAKTARAWLDPCGWVNTNGSSPRATLLSWLDFDFSGDRHGHHRVTREAFLGLVVQYSTVHAVCVRGWRMRRIEFWGEITK